MSQFINDKPARPYAFIKWMGTDVCMDFNCDCGYSLHIDAEFVYAVKCTQCGSIWEIPCFITPRKVEKHDCVHFED